MTLGPLVSRLTPHRAAHEGRRAKENRKKRKEKKHLFVMPHACVSRLTPSALLFSARKRTRVVLACLLVLACLRL
jgi:hypothetical protein